MDAGGDRIGLEDEVLALGQGQARAVVEQRQRAGVGGERTEIAGDDVVFVRAGQAIGSSSSSRLR